MKKRAKLRLVGRDEGSDGASVFDDLAKLRADMASAETAHSPTKSTGSRPMRRRRSEETFARIPHDRALELYRRHRIGGPAWLVLIELDRLILSQRGKNPVLFWSPKLRAAGLTGGHKARALRELEAAKVIEVTWRENGLSPLVRHLWHPRHD